MLKILVASSKGGCGKSTITTNLAAHYAEGKKNTAIIDTDRQGSSFHWCQRRPEGVPGVLGMQGARKGWSERMPEGTERVIVDTAAGMHADDIAGLVDEVDAMIVPVLPSTFDLEATAQYLKEIRRLSPIKRGKVPVALVANRTKPWTNATQEALNAMQAFPFPVVAQLRDSMGYVVLTGLGKSIFDYGSEQVVSHQHDWQPLLRWLKKLG